jgi:hypothetical protein
MAKKYGYVVSCPRIPQGRYFKKLIDAKKEMERQIIKTGCSQSGIREVYADEWKRAKRLGKVV